MWGILFPDTVSHGIFYLVHPTGRREKPIAAGFVGLTHNGNGERSVVHTFGASRELSMGSDDAYSFAHWCQLHNETRLPGTEFFVPYYDNQSLFVFPFAVGAKFGLRAKVSGKIENRRPATVEEFIRYLGAPRTSVGWFTE